MPQPGDVVVIDPNDKHPYGHIAMFDGLNWYSDYKQRTWHGLRGAAYNSYKIWRYDPSKTNMSAVLEGTNLPRADISADTRRLLEGFMNGTNQYLLVNYRHLFF